MKKFIFITIVLIFSSSCEVAPLLSTSFSKDYCSCRFVIGQSDSYCAEVVAQVVDIGKYRVSLEKKEVWSRGLGHEAIAKFFPSKGCLIVKSSPIK